MAVAAGDSPVGRSAKFEEQFLAQGNFPGGLRVVGRYRCASGVGGDASLLRRLWLGERFSLGTEHGLGVLLFRSGRRSIRSRRSAEGVQRYAHQDSPQRDRALRTPHETLSATPHL